MIKGFIAFFLLTLSFAVLAAQPDLFPFKVGDKYGYINRQGKFLIPLQFDSASYFHEGLAKVSVGDHRDVKYHVLTGGSYGWINRKGKFVINPQFYLAGDFSEGLAPVCIDGKDTVVSFGNIKIPTKNGGKCGFINTTGSFVIQPKFSSFVNFSDGLAAVSPDGKKWGLINKAGKYVIPPKYAQIYGCSEGLCGVKVSGPDGKWGFINYAGKFLITPQFDEAGFFRNGIAQVSVGSKQGYIKKTGKFYINPIYSRASLTLERLTPVAVPSDNSLENIQHAKEGYIDQTGKFIIKPEFDYAGPFKNGFAEVEVNKKWGVINETGDFVS